MKMTRMWAMPSANTFSIKPINNLISEYLTPLQRELILDPFSRNNPFQKCVVTNDIDTDFTADYHLDALEFLKLFEDESSSLVFFDPPYSPRQVSECYKKMDKTVNMKTTQASFWGNIKKEISRVTKKGAFVISCGWNSGGVGKNLGFEIVEILLVAHGGWHNDTIVTVEQKL